MMRLKLLIIFSLAISLQSAENIKSISGVAKANIKAVGAVAEANIKSVGGVDNTTGGGGTTGGGDNITFVDASEEVVDKTGNTVIVDPTGATTDDVYIAFAVCETASSITIPSGWTSLAAGVNAGGLFDYSVSTIKRGGSAPDLTWIIGGASMYREVHVLCYRGVDTVTMLDVAFVDGTVTTGTNPDAPAITTVNNNAMVVIGGVNWNGSSGSTWGHAAYTIRVRDIAGDDVVMADLKKVTAGAENPAAFSGGSGSTAQWQWTIALRD